MPGQQATGPELGDALREECPEIMAALENVGNEAEEREQRQAELERQVSVELDRCTSDGADGTVVNNSNATVDITIEVEYTDDSGVLLDTGLDFVNSVQPGQTAKWDTLFFGDDLAQCRAVVDSVRES